MFRIVFVTALEAWNRMYVEDGVTDGAGYELNQMRGAGRGAAPSAASAGLAAAS